MQLKKFFSLLIFLISPGLALHAEDYSDCDSVRFEDFKVIYDLGKLYGRQIGIELEYPFDMNFLGEKHFIYTEFRKTPLLRIVDIDSLDCIGYINAGLGQYDMMSVSDIQVRPDSTVTSHDMSTGKFFEFKWQPPMTLNLISVLQLNKNVAFNVTKTGENEFIWSGNSCTEFLCHKRDSKGKVSSFSPIPEVPKEEGVEVNDYDVQTKIYWNNRKNRLVSAVKPWDIISLYDERLNLIKRMRGPLFIERLIRDNKGVTHVPWPSIHGFSGSIQAGEAGFSVAYGGMPAKEEDTRTLLQYIISFDWEGNPLSVIKTDKPGVAYAYNIDSKMLLLVTEENNMLVLTQYDLNSLNPQDDK